MLRIVGSWAWASTFALFACQVSAQAEPHTALSPAATKAPAKAKGDKKAKAPAGEASDDTKSAAGPKGEAKSSDKSKKSTSSADKSETENKKQKPKNAEEEQPKKVDETDKGEAKKAAEPKEKPKPIFSPARVSLGKLEFNGGQIDLIERMLKKTRKRVGSCVDDNGGLSKSKGLVKLQFLVRSRGRAEGVEILKQRAMGDQAARCIRQVMKNRWVGTPSNDPVGVVFTYHFSATAKGSK
jgi:hypothetical protein